MTRNQMIKLIVAASNYKEGENDIGSVYMGGMATASLCHALGIKYGGDVSISRGCRDATDSQLQKAFKVCEHYIDYMKKNPVGKCPCCGQIVSTKKAKAK
jgi:hypothetical protein